MLLDLASYRRALMVGNPGKAIPAEAVAVYALQSELAALHMPPKPRSAAFQHVGNTMLQASGHAAMTSGQYAKGAAWLLERDGGRDADA